MQWETRKVLVTVKAYPEKSTKYGETVCVAGITEEGEFIRLYPVRFSYFRGDEAIKKFSWIEVECAKNADEKLQRKESHKIRDATGIRVVDARLAELPSNKKERNRVWDERNDLVLPLISDSIETLVERFKEDKTSLGLIKVTDLIEFYARKPIHEIDMDESRMMQATLFKDARSVLQQIPHIFAYRFRCSDSCPTVHDMNVEDWEVFAFFRNCFKFYHGDYGVLWEKMKDKFERFMNSRDLHFFMGTESQYGRWMIVGLYYPPRSSQTHLT